MTRKRSKTWRAAAARSRLTDTQATALAVLCPSYRSPCSVRETTSAQGETRWHAGHTCQAEDEALAEVERLKALL
jgi:hypothetical protein